MRFFGYKMGAVRLQYLLKPGIYRSTFNSFFIASFF